MKKGKLIWEMLYDDYFHCAIYERDSDVFYLEIRTESNQHLVHAGLITKPQGVYAIEDQFMAWEEHITKTVERYYSAWEEAHKESDPLIRATYPILNQIDRIRREYGPSTTTDS